MPEVGEGSAASASATALHLRSEKSDPSSGLCSSQSGPSNPAEIPQGSFQQQQQHAAATVTGTSCSHMAITSSLPMPSLGNSARRICPQDIQFVQNLIERCLQLYLPQREVVATLHKQAQIEPGFTLLIWQKLEEQNPDFFRGYYLRLKVKEQVVLFNHLLEQQVAMVSKLHMSWMNTMPPVMAHHHHHHPGVMAGMPPGMAPHTMVGHHHMVAQPGMAMSGHHPFAPFPMMPPQMMHQRMAMMGGMLPPPPMAMFPAHPQHAAAAAAAAAAGYPSPTIHMPSQQQHDVKAGPPSNPQQQPHQVSHQHQLMQEDCGVAAASRPGTRVQEAVPTQEHSMTLLRPAQHTDMNGHAPSGLSCPAPPPLGADPGLLAGPLGSLANQARDELGFPVSLGVSNALHDAHSSGDVLMAMQDGMSDGHDALLALRCNSGELAAHLASTFDGAYGGDGGQQQGGWGNEGRTRSDMDMGGPGACGPSGGEGGDLPHIPRVFSFSDFGNFDLPPGQAGIKSEGISLTDFDLPPGQMGKGEGLGMFDFDPSYLHDFDHPNTMCPFSLSDMALDFSSPPHKA